ITGGSRGIGAATARLFARVGAAVLVQYKGNAEAAASLLGELPAPAGAEHLSFQADLSKPEAIAALFAFARERWGGLDVLVNNAGIWVHGPLATLREEHLAETLALNVAAPFFCVREALPLLAGSD